jgi:hypothetical protein
MILAYVKGLLAQLIPDVLGAKEPAERVDGAGDSLRLITSAVHGVEREVYVSSRWSYQ